MRWLRQLFTRRLRYEELSESIREHLDEKIADLMDDGMKREEAEQAARREFGNVTRIEEQSREVWQWSALESILSDLKYAMRQMRRAPGFSAVVVLILALGIGANTTVFSIVDAVMLRPLPFAHPQKLVEVKASEEQQFESDDVSYPDFFDWRSQARSFEHMLAFHDVSETLTGGERPLRLDGQVVSWEMVSTLGVSPELGRGFSPEDEKRGSRVLLISHAFWKTQFAGDRSVPGRSIRLGGVLYTVIGVMPAAFRFPIAQPNNSFWTTLAVDADPTDIRPLTENRSVHFLTVVGRLKPAVTIAQADQEMKALAAGLAKQYPETNTRHSSAWVQSELASVLGDTSTLLLIVLGAVTLVLLIACGNIANLLLARVHERYREIAMRSALGASRARIVRQLLAESLLLGMVGGISGCLLAFACTPAVLRLIGDSVPRAADAGVDLPTLGFAIAVSLLSGAIFGIIPALTASRTDFVSTLKDGGYSNISGHHWLRSAVTVGQVALGIVVTVGAGLFLTSFVTLAHMDEGFAPDHLLTFNFELPDSNYQITRPQFYRQYFERLRALPGVRAAAGAHNLPMTDDLAMISFEDPEHPRPGGQRAMADMTFISSDYFRTLQVPLLRGRDFSDADDAGAPQVMIVNEAFAKQNLPGEDVLGKKLRPGATTGAAGGPPMREVVGVVGSIRHFGTQREMPPAMYLPVGQLPNWCCLRTVVRTSVDPMSLAPSVRQLVASMDPNLPVTEIRTMKDLLSLQLAQPRFAMIFLGTFAGLALLLTIVGLYGVMAFSVSRRTREIGLRLALGAQRGAVVRMILRDAALLLLTGIAVGAAVSLAFGSVLKSALYGINPRDPLVLIAVCAVVAITGLLATYIPSIQAASIDPLKALRNE